MGLRKNDWSLNKDAFDRLLARLDPDRVWMHRMSCGLPCL
jgi:hypothetical protein